MATTAIMIEIDLNKLAGYSDSHLATLWHLGQVNPAPHGDRRAGELVQRVGWEIIRRWLKTAPAEMYRHQPSHHDSAVRSAVARYRPGGADDRDGAFHDGQWTLNPQAIDAAAAGPPAGTACPYCAATEQLLRVEHGRGAGQVWICRDSEACRVRRWRAAEQDPSLTCVRCGRIPGAAAAPAELTKVDGPVDLGGPNAVFGPIDLGAVWVCVNRQHCDDRIGGGARPPYRYDRDMQIRVAEVGVANAVRDGLGPARCEVCGNTVPAELNAPHRPPAATAKVLGSDIVGAWRCRDEEACRARVEEPGHDGSAEPGSD